MKRAPRDLRGRGESCYCTAQKIHLLGILVLKKTYSCKVIENCGAQSSPRRLVSRCGRHSSRDRRSMRGFGLCSALIVAVHLRTAAGLSICGSWQHAAVLRPCGLRRTVLCTATNGLVNADSTLAQLRAYVKANGLEVKTAGPGRNKEAILSDILQITEGGKPVAATPVEREPETAVKEEMVVPQTSEPPAPADAEAATKAETATEAPTATDASPTTTAAPDAAPPDGFTWGATF